MINRYYQNNFPVNIDWAKVGKHTVKIENRISSITVGGTPNLTAVCLGEGIKTIEANCFANCTSLMSVDFIRPSSSNNGTQLDYVNANAFLNCSKLSSIKFNDNTVAKSIGSSAFSGCTSLSSIELSCESIATSAFAKCATNASLVDVNEKIASISCNYLSNCVFLDSDFDKIQLSNVISIKCSGPGGTVKPTDPTTEPCSIKKEFKNMERLGTFCNCKKLTEFEFPRSLVKIESENTIASGRGSEYQFPLFVNCQHLKKITVHMAKLTAIHDVAFTMIGNNTDQISIYFDDTRQACFDKLPNLDKIINYACNKENIEGNNKDCIVIFKDGRFDPTTPTTLCFENTDYETIANVKISKVDPETGKTDVGIDLDWNA